MTTPRPLKVLIPLHPSLDALDFIGPLEMLSHARLGPISSPHAATVAQPLAFITTIAAAEPLTESHQGVSFARDVDMETAYGSLADYDVLVVPGGEAPPVLLANGEPIGLVKAFAALPPREEEGAGHRTILSVCTGAMFLAEAGVLRGLTATTHHRWFESFEKMDVGRPVRARFVVNPVRDGLRVVTCGAVSSGLDGTLWLVESVVGEGGRKHVESITDYEGRQGVILG